MYKSGYRFCTRKHKNCGRTARTRTSSMKMSRKGHVLGLLDRIGKVQMKTECRSPEMPH